MKKWIVLCWILLTSIVISSNAQESTINLTSRYIIVAQNSYPEFLPNLDIIDWATNYRQDLWNYNRDGYKVGDFDIHAPYLYTIEVANTEPNSAFLLGSAEIFRTNLETNERLLLATTHNTQSMILGPRADRAILVQYDQEYVSDSDVLTLGRPNSFCVIIWEQLEQDCSPLTINGSFSPIWISDTEILLQSTEGLAVVDTETMNLEIVGQSQTFAEVMRIPQSDTTLLTRRDSTSQNCEILMFDLNARNLQSILNVECLSDIKILDISPDGRFVLLREEAEANTFDIFNLSDGSFIARHEAPLNMMWGRVFWLDNSFVVAELSFRDKKLLYVVFAAVSTPELLQVASVGDLEAADVIFPINEVSSTNE